MTDETGRRRMIDVPRSPWGMPATKSGILLGKRPVDSELALDLVDVLLRRLASEHDPDRVARHRVDQHERSERDADDDGQGVDQPKPEESEHEAATYPARRPPAATRPSSPS